MPLQDRAVSESVWTAEVAPWTTFLLSAPVVQLQIRADLPRPERSAQGPRDIGVLLRGLHGEAWILDRAAVNASSAHLREGLSNADRLFEAASIGSIDNIIFSGGDT